MIKISIVIPAHNEENCIESLLDNLYLTAERKPEEIIVVDAKSSDQTVKRVKEWRIKHPDCDLKLIELKQRAYPGAARNKGVIASKYSYIAFIDCGIIPESSWLKTIIETFNNNPSIEVVWCRNYSKPKTIWENAFAAVVEVKESNQRSVPSSCIKKESFYKLGMFREDLRAAEDEVYERDITELGLKEEYADADAWYTGYPDSCISAFEKWCIYTEYSVYADIYVKKLVLSVIELACLFCILYFCVQIYKSTLAAVTLTAVFIVIRVIISIMRSTVRIHSIKQFAIAVIIAISVDAGRICGLIKGFMKRRRIHNKQLNSDDKGIGDERLHSL